MTDKSQTVGLEVRIRMEGKRGGWRGKDRTRWEQRDVEGCDWPGSLDRISDNGDGTNLIMRPR